MSHETRHHLGGLDLNLLLALDALLRERNVTRAAESLRLTQPSVSAALAKLRRHFGDELLAREGNHYELTPLAARLAESTSAALAGVDRVFTTVRRFDPASSDRTFTLVMSDYAIAMLGEAISNAIAEQAPGVRLRLDPPDAATIERVPETLQTIDGVVAPRGLFTDLPHTELFTDGWVCVVSADNEAVGDELTVDQLGKLPWASSYYSPTSYTPVAQLEILGIEPPVQIVVGSYFALAALVAGTNRIALMQARLARLLTRSLNIKVVPCPFEAVPLIEALWWHPMHQHDPAHQWLRDLLTIASKSLPAAPV